MSFKDSVARDIHNVYLNQNEYAEKRTVQYDGETYEDILIVLTGIKGEKRTQTVKDHGQGLYIVTDVLHCAIADIGGYLPEVGQIMKINNQEGGGGFFKEFYVAYSHGDMGMARIELEAVAE